MAMNSIVGLAGVFLFAIGGLSLLIALNLMLHNYSYSPVANLGFGFIGFLSIGFGLFLISIGTKETPNS
jgi:hypothetical protein